MEWEEIEKTISAVEHDSLSAQDEATLQTFQRHIRILRSLLSLTRRMPLELWALIFEHSLSDIYAINCPDTSQIITISHVCRKWRTISLSTRRLWGNLPSLPFKNPKPSLEYISYVREILKRGKDTPISFHAADTLYTANRVPCGPHPVFFLLASQSHRWRDAIISSRERPSILLDEPSAILIQGRLPLLHTLELDFYSMTFSPLILNIFQHAPSLRVVKIMHNWPIILELPWDQLEEYTESNGSAENLINILRYSVNLRSLSCLNHELGAESFELSGQVVFNKLTSLQLHCGHSGNPYGLLLEHVTLPALTDLRVFGRGDKIIDDVIKLVKRSGCNLLRLTYFGDKSFSVSVQLALLLSLSPSLVELEANDSISDFTCACLERKLQLVITPMLRSLIIHIEHRIKKELLVVDAQRFNALAQRCCSQNRISRRDSDCVRLDVLGLRFEYPEQCLWFQQALQMWRYDPTDWSVLQNCVKELQEIDEELEDVFCCFAFDIEDQTSRMRTRLQTVLRTLEELPDIDPRIFLVSFIGYQ